MEKGGVSTEGDRGGLQRELGPRVALLSSVMQQAIKVDVHVVE